MGRTDRFTDMALLNLESGPHGAVSPDGMVAGAYVHGLFEHSQPRQLLVQSLAARRGYEWRAGPTRDRDVYDRLADVLEANLRLASTP